jgi:hypothetical protein
MYSENLFLEFYFGKEAGSTYLKGMRKNIKNDKPIIGSYDVNNEGSGDMYYKGANMLHTLRQIVNDDDKWRAILMRLNSAFYHQTVTSKQIEDDLSMEVGLDLKPFFNHYLRTTTIPTFEYYFDNKMLFYRWSNAVLGFDMPLKITLNGTEKWLYPESHWKQTTTDNEKTILEIDSNFYVAGYNILR